MTPPYRYRILLLRLLVLMFIYTGLRLAFLAWNWSYFEGDSLTTLLPPFVQGLRFDLSALITINAPFIIAAILFSERWMSARTYQAFEGTLFFLVNLFFIAVNIADIELYKFAGRRISIDTFSIAKDLQEQSLSMLLYYWYLVLFMLAVMVLFYKTYPRWRQKRPPIFLAHRSSTLRSRLAWGVIFLALAVIGARGGLQLKPLMPINAFAFENVDLGILSLNSTFTLTRSESTDQVQAPTYFKSREELIQALGVSETNSATAPSTGLLKGYNVIIVILESFSLEYMGKPNAYRGYTPFLDRIASEGTFFANSFANGRRSIEALPSILCSMPALMDQALITSNFQSSSFTCLGSDLKAQGYNTSFFHGAQNGSMFFDGFSRRSGFTKYFGLSEYPDSKDFDGHWGIYDEPFLQFAAETIDGFTEPFASVLFTLTSHHPYAVPPVYENQFPKGSLEIHKSIAYTDHALAQFFKTIKEKKWFERTLFVFTSDHTSLSDQAPYQDLLGRFRVPIIFWTPNQELPPAQPRSVAQHVDIYPSILDLLGHSEQKKQVFGRSLFADSVEPGVAYNRTPGGYWLLNQEYFVQINSQGDTHSTLAFETREDQDFPPRTISTDAPQAQHLTEKLKATVEYYYSGLIGNKWEVSAPPSTEQKESLTSEDAN